MKYEFTTTEDQETAITADAKGKTKNIESEVDGETVIEAVQLTNQEYVMTQIVDRFLAEVTNRGERLIKEEAAEKYASADPQVKAQIDALLVGG